jgi:hypothetical protein
VTDGDFPEFTQLLEQMRDVFGGREVDQSLIDAYWVVLKDLALSTIKVVAQQHLRYGKFFPKPVELRPREDRSPSMTAGNDADWKKLEADRVESMDWERVNNPVAFALSFNQSHLLQRLLSCEFGTAAYAEALREYHHWLGMARKPFAEQCAALPTFAHEHAMTRAQRIERMEYIRAQRAKGIKANQLVFATESRPRLALQDDRW